MKRLAVALLGAAAAFAQEDAVLVRAREVVAQRILQLPKYTCTALINRTYSEVTRGGAATCDKILGNRNRGLTATRKKATDRLRLDVEIADGGYELFSWPGGANFEGAKIDEMADGGPIGTGSFGAFLIDIFKNQGAQFMPQQAAELNGKNAIEYRFRVPVEASHYEVGVRGAYRLIGYDGHVWIDPVSFELMQLEVRTAELPPETGACEATTSVDLQRVHLGPGEYLAPLKSVLDVVGRFGSDSESVSTYSACHEFRGESTVQFGDTPSEPSPSAGVSAAQAPAFPPGLPVSLTFQTPIDSDSAAAGDPLVAQVVKAVVDPKSKRTVLPAGALLTGRMVHMEHQLAGKEDFILSVVFEVPNLIPDHPGQIAWVDKTTPCWESRRRFQSTGSGWQAEQQVESTGRLSLGGTFLLPSKDGRYVMPKGCVSKWLTAQ